MVEVAQHVLTNWMLPVKPMSVSVRQLCAIAGAHSALAYDELANVGCSPLICPGTQKLHTFRSIGRWLELLRERLRELRV